MGNKEFFGGDNSFFTLIQTIGSFSRGHLFTGA